MEAEALLDLRDVTLAFDGFRALDGFSLRLAAGELHCLIGPNGAGKSTLMDVITARLRPDTGTVRFDGQDLTLLRENDAAQLGIGRKFQTPTVFESLSVAHNLDLALSGSRHIAQALRQGGQAERRERIEAIATQISLHNDLQRPAALLAHGQKQWLEIGMLLAQAPRLLLLDEPVTGLTPAEVEATAALFDSLAQDHALLIVEHDMDFVRSIARNVTVMHQGRVLTAGSFQQVQNHPDVRTVYLGE